MAHGITIVADVIATNYCKLYYSVADGITTSFWLMLLPSISWLMLLPSVADGMATFL